MARPWPGLLAVISLVAGCGLSSTFECEEPSQCVDGSAVGMCQPDGWCSFPDPDCASGQRYGSHAGSGHSGECVDPSGSTGSDAGSASGDATTAMPETTAPTSVDGGETTTSASASTTMSVTTTSAETSAGSTSASATITDTAESDDGTQAVCGNNVLEQGEACDGTDLGGSTCASLGYDVGTLACTGACQLDASNCDNVEPYGPCNEDDDCVDASCVTDPGAGTCLPQCMGDPDCPNAREAMAPSCQGQLCVLPCLSDIDCPEDMHCLDSQFGTICVW